MAAHTTTRCHRKGVSCGRVPADSAGDILRPRKVTIDTAQPGGNVLVMGCVLRAFCMALGAQAIGHHAGAGLLRMDLVAGHAPHAHLSVPA